MNATAEALGPDCCPICRLTSHRCVRCNLREDREVFRAARRAILEARTLLAELRR